MSSLLGDITVPGGPEVHVGTLVNTHHHGGHTFGNWLLAAYNGGAPLTCLADRAPAGRGERPGPG